MPEQGKARHEGGASRGLLSPKHFVAAGCTVQERVSRAGPPEDLCMRCHGNHNGTPRQDGAGTVHVKTTSRHALIHSNQTSNYGYPERVCMYFWICMPLRIVPPWWCSKVKP